MGTGLISSSISGMQAAQIALQTAQHNISNQNTPGFNRQRIIQASNSAMLTGAGFIGQGAHVSTVERMYDQFLNTQVSRAQTTTSELSTYYAQISQIDNMLADANSGVSAALQDFFKGVQQVAANPAQLPARQSMVSSAEALVARFKGLDDRISQMYQDINGQITTQVASVNSYATQIAELNQNIVIAQSSINQPANDLLDQRDQLVSELNKLVSVATTTNRDGSFNVFFGTGQQLVVGAQVSTMTATPSTADPSRFTVGLKNAGGTQELPESLITGGSLSGLLKFRSESLDKTANQLGQNAASLALTFNAQHALGQDLLGNIYDPLNLNNGFVQKFFTEPTPKVVASSLNPTPSPEVKATFISPPPFKENFYTDLTSSDYRLASNGTNFTLTRLSDNVSWTAASIAALNTAVTTSTQGSQGFTIDNPATAFVAGSNYSYIIQPTRNAAKNIAVNAAISADVGKVAAAAPVRTALGALDVATNVITSNKGTATISAGSVGVGYPEVIAGSLPLQLTYESGSPATLRGFPVGMTVRVTSGTTVDDYVIPSPPALPSVPYKSGATVSILSATASIGISFDISGTPLAGDTFRIEKNLSGVSDGRNALLLGKLQTQNTMSGKTATYQSAYAQLVSDNGNKTRQIEVTGNAQQALLEQSQAAREGLSGVNLDEEAANLIRYQQAYQASAKSLQIGTGLFDTLLGIMS